MYYRYVQLIVYCITALTATAQSRLVNLDITTIPKSIQFTGKIVHAVRYTDSLGDNIVLTTETGAALTGNNGDNRDASVYAYHYFIQGDSANLSWKVNDFVKECPVDIAAAYIPGTFSITDLDRDGKAETWLMYKLACRGDVSPAAMKIIMYEGNQKSALRGTNKVKYSDTEYAGGEYSFDAAFINGPAIFRNYAAGLWKKHLLESWD